jgi:hypothetical protein
MKRQIYYRVYVKSHDIILYHNTDGVFKFTNDGERLGNDFNVNDILFDETGNFIPMIFTGLRDINNTDIYEGDIVCYKTKHNKWNGTVTWNNDIAGFEIVIGNNDWIEFNNDFCEVIGNIYTKQIN